jgi:hypothetical protein
MTKVGNRLQLGLERLEALAHATLDAYSARLKRAAAAGGTLAAGDIDAVAAAFRAEADADIKEAVRRIWESCVNDLPRALFDEARDYPFERILIQQFAHLLAPDGAAPAGTLSRRVIPGFLHALHMMIGPEQFEEYEARGKTIVDRLREQRGDLFNWSDFYQDPEAGWLANDVLVDVSGHFEDLARRRRWMIGVVDSHMTAPYPTLLAGNGAVGAADWRFGEAEFQALMRALYADLRRRFADASGRAQAIERYGDAAGRRLTRLFERLDEATPDAA